MIYSLLCGGYRTNAIKSACDREEYIISDPEQDGAAE